MAGSTRVHATVTDFRRNGAHSHLRRSAGTLRVCPRFLCLWSVGMKTTNSLQQLDCGAHLEHESGWLEHW